MRIRQKGILLQTGLRESKGFGNLLKMPFPKIFSKKAAMALSPKSFTAMETLMENSLTHGKKLLKIPFRNPFLKKRENIQE